jgi:hypothetical protein
LKEKKEDKERSKKSVKEFKYKMIKYPVFGAVWVFPLIIYSLFEYLKRNNNNTISEISIIRLKYFLFYIYSFISSIRGIFFFKLFISNERIKQYIHDKIDNIIFFENVMKNKINEISNYSYDDSNTSITRVKSSPKFNNFQEGLIDDRDESSNKDKHNNNQENSSNYEILSDDFLQNVKSENSIINSSSSSLKETQKDNKSNNQKSERKSLKDSDFLV